jgi:hypothetical protein
MTILFANNAASTLASGISNTDTSLTVSAGQGGLFPSPTGSDYFLCTLQSGTSFPIEIVKVTARSTDTFTIVRGQEGTTPQAWLTGAKVELRITAGEMNALFAGTATGAFIQNDIEVTSDYTITTGKNAGSFGPIIIDDGVTVTIPDGSVWSIV